MLLDLVHYLAVGDGPVTVFLESRWHRVESPEELRNIRLDDARGKQLGQFLEELGRKLVILLVRLQIRLINDLKCLVRKLTYRPGELLVLVLLQERRPDKDIRHLSLLGHILGESLARTNSTQATPLLGDCMRCSDRGRVVADAVEDVLQAGVRSGLDALRHNGITVVESVTSTKGLDEIVVSGTASRHNVEAVVLGDLDGVKSDACCNA